MGLITHICMAREKEITIENTGIESPITDRKKVEM